MGHRTQITLTEEQYDRLRRESERSGLSLAELVRRAVDRSHGSATHRELLDALDASFGSWAELDLDGEGYVDALRQGMARRLSEA